MYPPLPILGHARAEIAYDSIVKQTRDAVVAAGFSQIALGLSGGLDSALVAAIAVDALSLDAVPSTQVHGIIMPSCWTSEQSILDAHDLAKNLEIQTQSLDIMSSYESVTGTLAPVFAGAKSDTTEENIQARIRAVLLMALSNKFDWLVLSTTNLSEASVGFTTLYGDMAGAFAPLAPLYKSWVYELVHMRNERARVQGKVAPIPPSILEKEPSAELAPQQTDREALGSYEVLDALLYAYGTHLGDSACSCSVPQSTKDTGAYEHKFETLVDLGFDKDYVVKTIKKVKGSAYKRLQACPGAVLPKEMQ